MGGTKKAEWALRIGLAFSFLFAGIDGIKNPNDWVSYIPSDFVFFVTIYQALLIINILQIVLGVWLLGGKKLATASIISTLFFAGILFFNWSGLSVLFRDVSLLFASLALFFLVRGR